MLPSFRAHFRQAEMRSAILFDNGIGGLVQYLESRYLPQFKGANMPTKEHLKIADEVWLATAQLHQEHPQADDFSVDEIVWRAGKFEDPAAIRPGVYVHVIQHCVANRPPNPGKSRILFETSEGRRRLYRKADPFHPARAGSKVTPEPEDIPVEYQRLLLWYVDWSERAAQNQSARDPLLRLSGSGKRLWADEPADEYVERLREGWQ
jgi:hypothetical protein